jgi:hypothetical protein
LVKVKKRFTCSSSSSGGSRSDHGVEQPQEVGDLRVAQLRGQVQHLNLGAVAFHDGPVGAQLEQELDGGRLRVDHGHVESGAHVAAAVGDDAVDADPGLREHPDELVLPLVGGIVQGRPLDEVPLLPAPGQHLPDVPAQQERLERGDVVVVDSAAQRPLDLGDLGHLLLLGRRRE